MSPPAIITVVSPQFPCGAAWLANAFIELGVLPTELWGFDTAGEWTPQADGSLLYTDERLPWRQTLASLRPGLRRTFDANVQARFTHLFPWQLALPGPVVLVVRDPRDALHSQWRRQLHNREIDAATTFAAFCGQPFAGGPISNADMLWLHLRCWMERVASGSAILLRFEDWKRDDRLALGGLLARLGIVRMGAAVAQACDASRVEHLQAIERDVARADDRARQFNRRGLAGEWLLAWDREHHAALGAHWAPLLADLGYPPSPLQGAPAPAFDTAQVLAWRGLHAEPGAAHWSRRIGAWRRA